MRKTTKGKGFLGAVLVTITVAVLMFLLTGALLTGYFGGDTEPFGHRRRSVFCPAVSGGGSRRDHLFVPPLERDPRG